MSRSSRGGLLDLDHSAAGRRRAAVGVKGRPARMSEPDDSNATLTVSVGRLPISGAEKSHSIEFYHECVKRPNFTEVGLNHSPPGAYLLAFDRGITRCGSFYQVSHSLRRSASWGLFQL